ncbi:hypothetical protein PROFUN_10465 [Planoprotostelium fungivorum]|uniref:Uncharacterized protein n=1 Tax=Planoprotostelium fungivorum TaxID=1890364 RepID=A0A2P6NDG4_9EUKA|nr:hypothetical protein PROFUN_10465 [Planoprotostelium fungivorum]
MASVEKPQEKAVKVCSNDTHPSKVDNPKQTNKRQILKPCEESDLFCELLTSTLVAVVPASSNVFRGDGKI